MAEASSEFSAATGRMMEGNVMKKEKLTIGKGGNAQAEKAIAEAVMRAVTSPLGSAKVLVEDLAPSAQDVIRESIKDTIENGILKPRPDPFTKQRISQSRGLTYRGEMRLIAEFTTDPDGVKPAWQELEIWETRSGNWITVIMGKYNNKSRGDDDFTKATLFKDVRRDDLDFQIAVMESLDWAKAARVMVREQLGWKLIEEVE